jgi:sporulation protein YlmC with PRC-barrel domain
MEYVEPNLVKLSGSDFHLEEAWQDIRGFDAYDVDGDKIGTVKDFYIDREAHVTRLLDVEAGGFLGIGKKRYLIQVEEVTRNVGEEEDRVTVNHHRDTVLDSPDFDPEVVPDVAFQRDVYGHYGLPAPEGSSTTKITREEIAAKQESGDTADDGESRNEGGDGVIATVAKKAGKGAAKGAVKGAAKEVWKK